jgi:electron-transferring-flavoprotein dehydrogenase
MATNDARVVVVIGAGDLGSRVARLRAATGEQVFALRRRVPAAASGDGVSWLAADLVSGAGLDALPATPDAVVVAVAPDERSEAAYRALYLDGVARALVRFKALPRLVFVSSTAVYGEGAGEWIDEDTAPSPPAFNGQVLLEAEASAARFATRATALRLSGLYGPGRDFLRRSALQVSAGRRHWSNRIHIDDAAAAVSLLLDVPTPPSLLLGNDDAPALQWQVMNFLRAPVGLPPLPEPGGPVSGRRIANARLRALGWVPQYPSYREGYAR